MTTARTVTITDEGTGEPLTLTWDEGFDDGDDWAHCQWCDQPTTIGWTVFLGAGGLYVVCPTCMGPGD